jgi:hypothetical protein
VNKFCLLLISLILFMLIIPADAASETKPILSEMSYEECVVFCEGLVLSSLRIMLKSIGQDLP